MDTLIIWKALIIFLLTYSTFWIIFYTFQPDFLTDEDFVAPYIFLSLYLFRPTEVVCDKGAKSLAECKIMKRKK